MSDAKKLQPKEKGGQLTDKRTEKKTKEKATKPISFEDKKKAPKKWENLHFAFRNKHFSTIKDYQERFAMKLLKGMEMNTEGEAEASCLKALLFLKKLDQERVPDVVVAPCGDSLRYLKFKSFLHPCMLPQKKYDPIVLHLLHD